MLPDRISQLFLALAISSLTLAFSACGEEDPHDDPDHAHLIWDTTPETTQTVGTPADVAWMVHTEGELHITEIRACMGENAECGLGGMDSYDQNFPSTMDGEDSYSATVTLDTAGTWSVAVFAHVGETPHISDVIYVTVE